MQREVKCFDWSQIERREVQVVRLRLAEDVIRSEPVYVLLQRGEKRAVERIAKTQWKSRGAVLREAFLSLLDKGHYQKRGRKKKAS